ncbi:hypothetical protein SUDANB70_04653 [Streptomyces sp. enrichment culture]
MAARDFGLKGPRGWAFRGVSVDAEPGALIAVEGPSGSGRTCLLLALTGRMRPSRGRASVGGFDLPKRMAAVRRISALAHVTGVTDLDPALTVGEHLRERALLQRRFGDTLSAWLRPRGTRAEEEKRRVATALESAGLVPDTLPKGMRTAVRDLERVEALRLSVALALLGGPALLAVDDVDLKLSSAEREEVWDLFRALTAAGTTVVAVCSESPDDAVRVRTDAGTTPETPADDARPGATADDASAAEAKTEAEAEARAEGGSETGDTPAPTAPGDATDGTDGTDRTDPTDGTNRTDGTDAPDRTDATDAPAPHHDTKEEAADALAETRRS